MTASHEVMIPVTYELGLLRCWRKQGANKGSSIFIQGNTVGDPLVACAWEVVVAWNHGAVVAEAAGEVFPIGECAGGSSPDKISSEQYKGSALYCMKSNIMKAHSLAA